MGRRHICNEVGHKKWNRPRIKKAKTANISVEKEIMLIGMEEEAPTNLWICDSGATCHMIGEDFGLKNIQKLEKEVIVGYGRKLRSIKMEDLRVQFQQKNGINIEITLKDVKVVEVLK